MDAYCQQAFHEEGELALQGIIRLLDTGDESDHVGCAEPLVAFMGLSMEERTPHASYMWDGRSFNSGLPDRHILHDVAHWIVADPGRRSVPEFGLSHGPETDVRLDVERAVSRQEEAREETRAALLGVLLQHALGIPCGLIADEIGIEEQNAAEWTEPFLWLREHGLIDVHGMPAVVADMIADRRQDPDAPSFRTP